MKNLKLKSFLVVLLSLITMGLQAQQDPDPLSTTSTDKMEVTYQDYLKMQDDYLHGKVSKEALLKVFNQLTDELDEICHPQQKQNTVGTISTLKISDAQMNVILKVNELKKKDLAKN